MSLVAGGRTVEVGAAEGEGEEEVVPELAGRGNGRAPTPGRTGGVGGGALATGRGGSTLAGKSTVVDVARTAGEPAADERSGAMPLAVALGTSAWPSGGLPSARMAKNAAGPTSATLTTPIAMRSIFEPDVG